MNLVGKVNRARADRKLNHISLGSEDDNLVGQKLALKFAKIAFVVGAVFLKFPQLVENRKAL